MPETIYLVCKECTDPFYKGHPTTNAFTSLQAAEAACLELNGGPPEELGHDGPYYVLNIELFD